MCETPKVMCELPRTRTQETTDAYSNHTEETRLQFGLVHACTRNFMNFLFRKWLRMSMKTALFVICPVCFSDLMKALPILLNIVFCLSRSYPIFSFDFICPWIKTSLWQQVENQQLQFFWALALHSYSLRMSKHQLQNCSSVSIFLSFQNRGKMIRMVVFCI